jgi:shikimate kinase
MSNKNIVLLGFMGSGKSTVGRLIAETLGMEYVNTDAIIEERSGISINEIFRDKGEDYFRKMERQVVKDISMMTNAVIDAGGGVVINEANLRHLKANGLLFCLNASAEEIYRRTKSHAHRPLLNVPDPLKEIKEIIERRRSFYKKADYQIDTDGRTPEDVAREIEQVYEKASVRNG